MIGALCPRCGAPCSVSLATPNQIACAHCAYVGAPPAEAGREIHAAIGVLGGLAVRRRQLNGLQRRAVTSSWLYSALFLIFFALLVIPFALFTLILLLGPGPSNFFYTATLGFVPLLLVLVSGGFGLWWLRRSRRKLLDRCAAVPPPVPGQPARCHVCGAPLTAGGSGAVVRCGFCQADNVVTKDVLSRVAGRQHLVTTGLEQDVRRQASSFGMQSMLVNAFVLIMAFLAPIGGFVAAIAIGLGLSQLELEPDTSIRYVRYPTPAGQCLARIRDEGGRRILDFNSPPAPTMTSKLTLPEGRKLVELSVQDLLGLEVIGPNNRILKVDRVLRTEMDRTVNLLRMVDHEGLPQDVEAYGTCLPSGPRITQLAHRSALVLPDVHDMTSDGQRLLLAAGDLEIVAKAGGKLRGAQTTHSTWRVRAKEGVIVTLSRAEDATDNAFDLELRNSSGGAVSKLEHSVSLRPFTANADRVYYVRHGALYGIGWLDDKPVRQSAEDATVVAAQAHASGVYWLEYARADVLSDKKWSAMSRGLDSAEATLIAAGFDAADVPLLAVAGSRLIWLDGESRLLGVSVDGGEVTTLGQLPGARGIRADSRGIYIATSTNLDTRQQIVWLPADATDLAGLRVVAPRGGSIEAMLLEPDALYWVDGAYVMKLPR